MSGACQQNRDKGRDGPLLGIRRLFKGFLPSQLLDEGVAGSLLRLGWERHGNWWCDAIALVSRHHVGREKGGRMR